MITKEIILANHRLKTIDNPVNQSKFEPSIYFDKAGTIKPVLFLIG